VLHKASAIEIASACLWIWRTGWPRVARLTLVAGLAGWNLLVLMPRPA
jgi:hypothetical protein